MFHPFLSLLNIHEFVCAFSVSVCLLRYMCVYVCVRDSESLLEETCQLAGGYIKQSHRLEVIMGVDLSAVTNYKNVLCFCACVWDAEDLVAGQ